MEDANVTCQVGVRRFQSKDKFTRNFYLDAFGFPDFHPLQVLFMRIQAVVGGNREIQKHRGRSFL
jgi:hypothetical protein